MSRAGRLYASSPLLVRHDSGFGSNADLIGGAIPRAYLILPETVVNVVDRLVPTAVTAVMMTTAIKAAIKPYSMAVAPPSSAMKRAKVFIKFPPRESMMWQPWH